jgi:hypothetical protein
MSKPTAVEWLFNKMITEKHTISEWNIICKEAKEMEKEQIKEAHGDERDYRLDSGNFITISAEQYYNEIYKKEDK